MLDVRFPFARRGPPSYVFRPMSKKSTRPPEESESKRPPAKHRTARKPGQVEHLFPTVALVGRPNVGKSSLFNALLRQEISITDARAGTTRDRVLHPVSFEGKSCDLLDTGGIGIVDKQDLSALVESQIQAALANATVLALVVDSKEGLTPLDRQIAQRLHALGRPVVVVANKSEGREAALTVGEFAELGFEEVIATSAVHRRGLDDLSEALARHLTVSEEPLANAELLPKVAVVGRRNVGKSSFINALVRSERTIVSDIAGTTRDSIDVLMEKDETRFYMIDTAGIRRMKAPEGPVEFYSQVRTERAIRRADVVMLMLDPHEGVSTTDRKTADLIRESFKPCVIVVNKWDTTGKAVTEDYADYITTRLPALRHAPVCFTSAKMGSRCWQTVDLALELYKLSRIEIPTPKLNEVLVRSEREHEPPGVKGKKPRLLYAVQVGVSPPTIVVHGRHTSKIDEKYKRYLALRMAELMGLDEVPLRLFLRETTKRKKNK